MNLMRNYWPPSSILMIAVGIALGGVGLHFILLRPPLLPEDVRYMGLSAVQLDVIKPHLEIWLPHVFRVMGGYVLATGVLTITLATTSFRSHNWGAALGMLIGGAASIGWMAVVYIVIDSGFKWVSLAVALVWAVSLGLFCYEKGGVEDC